MAATDGANKVPFNIITNRFDSVNIDFSEERLAERLARKCRWLVLWASRLTSIGPISRVRRPSLRRPGVLGPVQCVNQHRQHGESTCGLCAGQLAGLCNRRRRGTRAKTDLDSCGGRCGTFGILNVQAPAVVLSGAGQGVEYGFSPKDLKLSTCILPQRHLSPAERIPLGLNYRFAGIKLG
jgi:hypothetical protein